MFVDIDLRKVMIGGAIFQLSLAILAPILHIIIGPGNFDTQFLSIYLVFIIIIPLVYLYFVCKKISTTNSESVTLKRTSIHLEKDRDIQKLIVDIIKKQKWRIKSSSPGFYEIETPLTLTSFGEIITIAVDTSNEIVVHLTSESKVHITEIDYGKNAENLKFISDHLEHSN